MPQLNNLKIQNFRLLQNLEIPQLGQVNLIVGKNNAGKSTVLEALCIYESLGSPLLLEEVLEKHDELEDITNGEGILSVENFFTNRSFSQNGEEIYIGNTDQTEYVKMKQTYFMLEKSAEELEDIILRRRVRKELEKAALKTYEGVRQSLKIITKNYQLEKPTVASRFDPPGILQTWLDFQSYDHDDYQLAQLELQKMGLKLISNYVPTDFIPLSKLAAIWDDIFLTHGQQVIEGLKLIDPKVEGLTFRNVNQSGSGTERKPFVKLKGQEQLEPLRSYGDGIRRILQLFLYLVQAKGRFLLIDEFENGLHYTVQPKVWELIFKLAKDLNVQVFATTHSWDCVTAFQQVSQDSEEEAILFRLGHSIRTTNKGQVIARVYDKESLQRVTQADLEVR
ncbi:AAA family ATPase [Candidatus Parabeggiatoa sp. HSG14]|uniref:AAA family ATPase n=1 Tax=Candidatus Parabeggiatoa sp. HSG14 TaxID=3055593 RepID=UPI0025A80B14|nr:AAA family ATPase [Thiotrichales bacterium HSG14]